jgi:hypothetical protein
MLRFEFAGLQFHDYVAVGRHVIEQKVNEEVIPIHVQVVLASDESEAGAELGQRLGHPQRHGLLHRKSLRLFGQAQKIKHQGVLGDLPGQVAALARQPRLEVVRGRPVRVWRRVRIWCSSTATDQPFWTALEAYHGRNW